MNITATENTDMEAAVKVPAQQGFSLRTSIRSRIVSGDGLEVEDTG